MTVSFKRKIALLIGCSLCVLFLFSCSDDDNDSLAGPSNETSQLKIGALFDFDENGPVHGQSTLAALQTAEADINAYFDENGIDTNIVFETKDTEYDFLTMLDLYAEMVEDGISVILAPLTSAETILLIEPALQDGVTLISPTSTSTNLALDDNLIRLLPDDRSQAEILSNVMIADGVRTLVTVYRNDFWGEGLSQGLGEAFASSGGTLAGSFDYFAEIPEMNMETLVSNLAETVSKSLENTDASRIAVHISCFEEGVDYLKEAAKYPDLAEVKWYSADGFAKNAALLEDSEAAAFAVTTGLSASQLGEPSSSEYIAKQEAIAEITGKTPYSLAMLLYDGAWIAAKAAVEADMKDSAAYMAKVLELAESHNGLFGKAKMNENGDRANGSYDFWTLSGSEGAYTWEKTATYQIGE